MCKANRQKLCLKRLVLKMNKEELIKCLTKWQEVFNFAEIIPLSAKMKDNIPTLLNVIKDLAK